MKAQDIVNQLAVLLPQHTDKFTTNFSVVSLVRSGTTVTVTTNIDHGLVVGKQVNIIGAQTPLTISSLTRVGTIGTLVTDGNHDLTENYIQQIELSGSTESEFNGFFNILNAPNRKTITFSMVDSGPTIATGSPLLLNGASALQQYNGLYPVATVPTTDSFTYEIVDTTLFSPAAGTIVVKSEPRISAAASIDFLIDAYTRKPQDDYWAFVVLGDPFASKSRSINSDATNNLQRSNEYRQQIIYTFSVLVFFPTTNEILARQSRDSAEDMFRPLCQSLLGSKINSGLFVGAQNPINFTNHGLFSYNKAFYVHQYNFETVADLTFEDTIGFDLDVAFRNINFDIFVDPGNQEDPLTAEIDLDDIPI